MLNSECIVFLFFLVCGECIGGTTGKKEEDVKSCGTCKNVQTLISMISSKCDQDCEAKTMEVCDQCVSTREEQAAGKPSICSTCFPLFHQIFIKFT